MAYTKKEESHVADKEMLFPLSQIDRWTDVFENKYLQWPICPPEMRGFKFETACYFRYIQLSMYSCKVQAGLLWRVD